MEKGYSTAIKTEGRRGIKADTTYPAAERCPSLARKLSMLQCLIALREDPGCSCWETQDRKPRQLAPESQDSKKKRHFKAIQISNAGNS